MKHLKITKSKESCFRRCLLIKIQAFGIISHEGELLAVYLDKCTAENQLQYFKHRSPVVITLQGEFHERTSL